MSRHLVHAPAFVALALALAACGPDATTAPGLAAAPPLLDKGGNVGPPKPRPFGPDTYRTGLFTGAGTTTPGLSCAPPSSGSRTCTGFLASAVDGALLDVTLQVPQTGGPFPIVALLHGWGGSKSGSGDIASSLLADGYAVLRYSARGFGESWGQVNLADINVEIADLRSIIGQVVDQQALGLDPGAVAVTGASYGGGQSWLAALAPTFRSPAGQTVTIRTIVPIVPWTDLVYSLLPNGRPRMSLDPLGAEKLSYVNGLYASGLRDDLERPYPNYPDYLVAWHGWLNTTEPSTADPVYRQIVDGIGGYRSIWWQQQFWQSAAATRLPVFQVQGFTDDLFPLPEAKRMLLALKSVDPTYPIAAYFGDIGHPRASNKPGEVDYALGLIRQWLAYYLKGAGAAPPNVIYAAITRPRGQPFNPADVITVNSYGELATGSVAKDFAGTTVLVNPLSDPLAGFFWDPLVMEGAAELRPYGPPPPSATVSTSLATYEVPVSQLSGGSALLIAGQPAVALHASTLAARVQLDVRLFDVAPDGTRELVTRGTYTLDSGTGLPVGTTDVTIPTYGNLWQAAADHVLRLELSNLDSPYIAPSKVPSTTEISDVRLQVPIR